MLAMLTKRVIGSCAAGFLLLATLSIPAAAAPDAGRLTQFIDGLSGQVISVVGDDSIDKEAREARIRDILRDNVALAAIGKFALGDHWDKATESQQSDYLAAFSDYVLLTYSRLLGAYGGETFTIEGTKTLSDTDLYVLSEIHQSNGKKVRAAWRVREKDGTTLIIDVVVDGVSLAVTQQSEIASVARSKGIDGLIAALQQRTSE